MFFRFLTIFVLFSFPVFAFDLKDIKINGGPSTSGGVSIGRSPQDIANEVKSYLKSKFPSEGDVLKTSMSKAISTMKARYGSPTKQTSYAVDWVIKARGTECTKIRFSGHGNQVNITQVLGECSSVN